MSRPNTRHDPEKTKAILGMYYANSGTYNYETDSGSPGEWKNSFNDIKKAFKLHSDAAILSHVRRHGPGLRTKLRISRQTGAVNGEDLNLPARYQVARNAGLHMVMELVLSSPRAVHFLHTMSKEIAKAMGVTSPDLLDVQKHLAKIRKAPSADTD